MSLLGCFDEKSVGALEIAPLAAGRLQQSQGQFDFLFRAALVVHRASLTKVGGDIQSRFVPFIKLFKSA